MKAVHTTTKSTLSTGEAPGGDVKNSVHLIQFGGVEVNLEIKNGQARQLRELIFVESSGKTHHLPIREHTTAERLLQAFKDLGVVKPFETRLSCDPEERTWVEPLLRQAGAGLQPNLGRGYPRKQDL